MMEIIIAEAGSLHMLSRTASTLVSAVGRLSVTCDPGAEIAPGGIIAANHTSLADPAIVIAALYRLGVSPVVMATSGLWRIPLLGRALTREGHIPVHRRDLRAADALELAAQALRQGRSVLIYAEGGLPRRKDATEAAPGGFRTGLARLAERTGAPVVPVGQAGARRVTSGSTIKQIMRPRHSAATPTRPARPRRCPDRSDRRRKRTYGAGPRRGDDRMEDGGRAPR